jgi:hypothetical protein
LSQSRLDCFASRHPSPSQFDCLAPPWPQAPIAKPLRAAAAKLRRSIVSSPGYDRPSDARHIVGNGNSDELGRLLGQQSHDPGILLRLLPSVSNSGCWTDCDEKPSEIAISLLGDAAEPLLAPVECCRGTPSITAKMIAGSRIDSPAPCSG